MATILIVDDRASNRQFLTTLLGALGNVPPSTGEIQLVEPPSTIPVDIITQTLLASTNGQSGLLENAESESK